MTCKASAVCGLLARLRQETLAKLQGTPKLDDEYYDVLERVPPAPGRPDAQHDAMVRQGLCRRAEQNVVRNRYCNQYPFDSHAVDLATGAGARTSYINASWIRLPRIPGKFIVTMGPMHPSNCDRNGQECPDTCADFWEMVWQTGAGTVAMLCRVERGFTGCAGYFPAEKGAEAEFGRFRVSCEERTSAGGAGAADVRTLRLRKVGADEEERTVRHFQYLAWPNYGLPSDSASLADFVRLVRGHVRQGERPGQDDDLQLVVHCSGGLGRSGTFLTIYAAYDALARAHAQGTEEPLAGLVKTGAEEVELQLADLVKAMRGQRHPWMVEGTGQYAIAYKTILQLMPTVCPKMSKNMK